MSLAAAMDQVASAASAIGRLGGRHVNLDSKCIHCGKGGATPSGRCMGCMAKCITKYGLDHAKWPRSGKIAR